ncbi:hypothetical protein ACFWYW_24225 [Nonomuraea sp. NPDC059023]|uniref:hypothetical protein n=1 Tax=unclassified Nonomuraea TaxID=2593643 RepID=UPI003675A623
MAQLIAEVGKPYRLVDDFGVGPGSLPAGAEVVVTGIYPPGTPGIGLSEEDTVLADYTRADDSVQTIAVGVTEFEQRFVAVS